MYTVKQAAARAGVSVPVLRAWERRYGIVRPDRTAAGYRLFDDDAVARIRTMRHLVDEGWSPSNAAAAITAGMVSLTDVSTAGHGGALGGSTTQPAHDVNDGEVGPAAHESIVTRFVEGARLLEPRVIATVLDDVFARGSFERVVSELLFPALEALGAAWASGTITAAGEHLATYAVQRRLGQALEAAGPPPSGRLGRILVGMPPGGRHELGALAFAVAARRAGLPVAYLGADLPAEDWLAAAEHATAAVIGAMVPRDRAAALDVAHRLRAADTKLVIAFGGRAAPADSDYLRLPGGLAESVAALLDALPGAASAA